MKNLWKKAQKIIACALALAFVFTMSVGATESIMPLTDDSTIFSLLVNGYNIRVSEGTIVDKEGDTKAKLVIHKYSYKGASQEGTGLPVDIDKAFSDEATRPTALAGVKFKYFKVASFSQVITNGQVSLKYDLRCNKLSEVFSKQNQTVNDVATSEELSKALQECLKDYKSFEKNANNTLTNGVVTEATGNDGIVTADELTLGLYLVLEYEAPATVQEETVPFLVSLPMTNAEIVTSGTGQGKTYEAGSLWQYDVHVYPKNIEMIPDIEKNIVHTVTDKNGDLVTTEEKYEGATVGGEPVTFRIKASIPKGIANMSKFTVVDTMSKGLTFVRVTKIGIHNSSDINCEELSDAESLPGSVPVKSEKLGVTEDKDYTNGTQLTWAFIETKENGEKTNHLSNVYADDATVFDKELVIEYEAVLNENCVVGGMGNPNGVKLVYNHSAGVTTAEKDDEVEHPTKSRVYTFGINVTKSKGNVSGDLATTKMSGVKFRLYKDKEMKSEIKMASGQIQGSSTDTNSYHPVTGAKDEEVVEDMVTGENEQIYIWGLEPGTYYLKETATKPGFILLKDPIEIRIKEKITYIAKYDGEASTYILKSDSGTTYESEFYKLVGGNYVKIKIPAYAVDAEGREVYNFGTDAIYLRKTDGSGYDKLETVLEYAKLGVQNDQDYSVTDNTNVSLTVINNPKFAVPQTGGIGTWMFTICGAVIVVAAVGLILIRRKKSMAK